MSKKSSGKPSTIDYSISFYVGDTNSVYVLSKDKSQGIDFNGIDQGHMFQIYDLFKSSFLKIIGRAYIESETFEDISNEDFKNFFWDFYKQVHDNANPVNGIGILPSIAIIRNGRFEWIENTNKRIRAFE
jgi:hypothetical protein